MSTHFRIFLKIHHWSVRLPEWSLGRISDARENVFFIFEITAQKVVETKKILCVFDYN